MRTLGYAVLGLLAERPHTGYDIARRMERPIGYFWTAQHSQIYPELARLEADGLVRHRVVDGPGPRDTKRYRITPAGRAALRAWVDAPVPAQPGRSELLLRVRSLWVVGPRPAAPPPPRAPAARPLAVAPRPRAGRPVPAPRPPRARRGARRLPPGGS